MTQRIFNTENKRDIKDLFNLLPDWVNCITKFESGKITGFKQEPTENTAYFGIELERIFNIEFKGNNIIQRPINYQDCIRKWGVFGDFPEYIINLKQHGLIGLLREYRVGEKFPFKNDFKSFRYFRPLTLEEKQQIMEN